MHMMPTSSGSIRLWLRLWLCVCCYVEWDFVAAEIRIGEATLMVDSSNDNAFTMSSKLVVNGTLNGEDVSELGTSVRSLQAAVVANLDQPISTVLSRIADIEKKMLILMANMTMMLEMQANLITDVATLNTDVSNVHASVTVAGSGAFAGLTAATYDGRWYSTHRGLCHTEYPGTHMCRHEELKQSRVWADSTVTDDFWIPDAVEIATGIWNSGGNGYVVIQGLSKENHRGSAGHTQQQTNDWSGFMVSNCWEGTSNAGSHFGGYRRGPTLLTETIACSTAMKYPCCY